jgi:hypothetical protein
MLLVVHHQNCTGYLKKVNQSVNRKTLVPKTEQNWLGLFRFPEIIG